MNLEVLKRNIKSKTFWVSVGAFILLILHTFGFNVVDSKYNDIVNSILGILTMVGILNNPQIEQ